MKKWSDLPKELQKEEIKPYYDVLKARSIQRFIKRAFDISASLLLAVIVFPLALCLAMVVGCSSRGGVFFRQMRITRYGKPFWILKFRTMVKDAESMGTQVTVGNDARITGIGRFLRKYRLDELPQLWNVLVGEMSFVGTRPEVKRYVDQYTVEMKATLLQRAGITSDASIRYKDEDVILSASTDPEKTYVDTVLPQKMEYNLRQIKGFSIKNDFFTMIHTVFGVIKREKSC